MTCLLRYHLGPSCPKVHMGPGAWQSVPSLSQSQSSLWLVLLLNAQIHPPIPGLTGSPQYTPCSSMLHGAP